MFPDATIETIIAIAGYAGIFGLMIANGALSFPSSQAIYIIAGYFIARGDLALLPTILSGALGNTIGNIILYELARTHGRTFIARMKLFPERELAKVEAAFRKKGAWFLFVGKLLPAIKVFIPIPAGLGKMHRGSFALLMFTASMIWTFPLLAIGYFFGKSSHLAGSYAVILIIVAATVVFLFYYYLNSIEITKGTNARV